MSIMNVTLPAPPHSADYAQFSKRGSDRPSPTPLHPTVPLPPWRHVYTKQFILDASRTGRMGVCKTLGLICKEKKERRKKKGFRFKTSSQVPETERPNSGRSRFRVLLPVPQRNVCRAAVVQSIICKFFCPSRYLFVEAYLCSGKSATIMRYHQGSLYA
jgi:hypothetical protein